jgi:hypothetical protein
MWTGNRAIGEMRNTLKILVRKHSIKGREFCD